MQYQDSPEGISGASSSHRSWVNCPVQSAEVLPLQRCRPASSVSRPGWGTRCPLHWPPVPGGLPGTQEEDPKWSQEIAQIPRGRTASRGGRGHPGSGCLPPQKPGPQRAGTCGFLGPLPHAKTRSPRAAPPPGYCPCPWGRHVERPVPLS